MVFLKISAPIGEDPWQEFKNDVTEKFKHEAITDIILKSFYEVYNELGDGFLESVYETLLYIVLAGHGNSV